MRRLEFELSALGDRPRTTVGVSVFEEGGVPPSTVIGEIMPPPQEVGSEKEFIETILQELRLTARDPVALQTLVKSLKPAFWSLTLSEPCTLSATTLEAALAEVAEVAE